MCVRTCVGVDAFGLYLQPLSSRQKVKQKPKRDRTLVTTEEAQERRKGNEEEEETRGEGGIKRRRRKFIKNKTKEREAAH